MIFFGVLLASTLLALAIVDLRHLRLPDWMNGILAAFGLLQSVVIGAPQLSSAVLSGLTGGLTMYLVATVYRHIRSVEGLGLGDVKLVGAGMLWLDLRWLGPLLLIATGTAFCTIVLQAISVGEVDARRPFPFGPHLAVAILVCWGLDHLGY